MAFHSPNLGVICDRERDGVNYITLIVLMDQSDKPFVHFLLRKSNIEEELSDLFSIIIDDAVQSG